MKSKKTKNKIEELPIKCEFCEGGYINVQFEPDHTVKFKDGKPVCSRCRILKFGKFGNIIKEEIKKIEDDREAKQQQEENEKVAMIAMQSQVDTKTQIKRKRINKK